MGTCKNCRHWGAYRKHECNYTDLHEGFENNSKTFYVWADADDDQGLDSGLHTGPAFGCIHFVQKRE